MSALPIGAGLPACNPADAGPAQLCGDWSLTPRQLHLYLEYHAARNARNAAASRRERIRTFPLPRAHARLASDLSPPRADLHRFFSFAAHALRHRFRRDITILDVGCGGGPCAEFFDAAGYTGTYIGLDVYRKKTWSDRPTANLTKRLILGDVHTFDSSGLPPIDLLISSTALEHIPDDTGAIARLSRLLVPDAAQVHYVPGEGALSLYGPHGWRQYSPRCLRTLFPRGQIYRAGGPVSSLVHRVAITGPTQRRQPTLMVRAPRRYAMIRDLTLALDRLLGNRPPTMYGVIVA
jgi:2-polyprenyl-3-methyl-5-hydroxy-6-metoxy-1,4-benzoquinol methylase